MKYIRQYQRILSMLLCFLFVGSLKATAPLTDPNPVVVPVPPTATKIKIALLLDTSGSMDGLIEQAKSQLWKIVNELNKAKSQDGTPASLFISLYEYGNDGISSKVHYVRKIVGLTNDLDKISEKLFELTTNGGSEYCGRVIEASLDQLEWGQDESDLKMIFIAGNEPFNQDPVTGGDMLGGIYNIQQLNLNQTYNNAPIQQQITSSASASAPVQQQQAAPAVNNNAAGPAVAQQRTSIQNNVTTREDRDENPEHYKVICKRAKKEGVFVNTIFCGNADEGVRTFWKRGADLTNGQYMNIDSDLKTAYIETPYDSDLEKLNDRLNGTYIAYGVNGFSYQSNQLAQDGNAKFYSSANAAERVVSKSSHNYFNGDWDLVDAQKSESFNIEDVKEKNLPKEMQGMTKEEKLAYIAKKEKEREEIKKEISDINVKRVAYIEKKREEMGEEGLSLDAVMIKAIHEQAATKGLYFE